MSTGDVVLTVGMSSSGDGTAVVDIVDAATAVRQEQQQNCKSQRDGAEGLDADSVLQTVVSLDSSDADGGESLKGSCCRICMEDITDEDFQNETAIRLGCRCMDGLDVVHMHCAKKWFRLRRSLNCEICGYSVDNLPEKFQRKLQKLIEQTRRVDFHSDDDDEAEDSATLDAAHVRMFSVIVYGLIPAFLTFISVMFFFHGFLKIDIATSVVLAFALSTSTFMHFIMETRSGTWHLLFVLLYLVTVLSMASLFFSVYEWEGIAAGIAATLIGPMTAVVLFATLRTGVLICFPMCHLWNSSTLA